MIIINLILGFLLFGFVLKALGGLLKWFILYKLRNLTNTSFSKKDYEEPTETLGDQPLVPCAQCGLYIVKTEAIERSNRYYCCKNHLP